MIVLGVEVDDSTPLKGELRRVYRRARKTALYDTMEYWHEREMPRRFTPGNEQRYDLEPREEVYLEEIKKVTGVGQGRFVLQILTGRSLRMLRAFASITSTGDRATIRMTAPVYFTNPFEGTWIDPDTGETKTSSGQPDKVAELLYTPADERLRLAKKLERNIDVELRQPQPVRKRTIRG